MGIALICLPSCKKSAPPDAAQDQLGAGTSSKTDGKKDAMPKLGSERYYFIVGKNIDEMCDRALADTDPVQRAAALRSLGKVQASQKVVEAILNGLNERSWEIFRCAVLAASEQKLVEAEPLLKGITEEAPPQVRIWIAYALGNKGVIEGFSSDEFDCSVQAQALEALALMDRAEGGRGNVYIGELKSMAQAKDIAVKFNAFRSLAALGEADGVDGLMEIVADAAQSDALREKAALILGYGHFEEKKQDLAKSFPDAPSSLKLAIAKAYVNLGGTLEELKNPGNESEGKATEKTGG